MHNISIGRAVSKRLQESILYPPALQTVFSAQLPRCLEAAVSWAGAVPGALSPKKQFSGAVVGEGR